MESSPPPGDGEPPAENSTLPSPLRQAARLTRAALDEAIAIARGVAPITPEESGRRLDICRGCEHFAPAAERCAKCGCYVRIKIGWRDQNCPIGKW